MFNRIKQKSILIALSIAMSVSFTGCSMFGQKQPVSSSNEQVTLKWFFPGSAVQKDADKVWVEFNKRLQTVLPNTTIEFEQVSIVDYQEKWKLMAASGEAIDIAWNGYLNPYHQEIKKGSFLPLKELINKYAPDLKKEIPDWAWQKQTYMDEIYAVPNMQMVTKMLYGMRVKKEHADKYMNREKIDKALAANKTNTLETYQAIEEYLEALKANGVMNKGMSPSFGWSWDRGYEPIFGSSSKYVYIKIHDNDYKVYGVTDMPESRLHADVMHSWFEKGYIRKDIISLANSSGSINAGPDEQKGLYDIWVHHTFKGENERASKQTGFPVDIVPLESEAFIPYTEITTGTALPRTCKDSKRAIEFVELMHTDKGKDLYNLLVFGLEGEHYKKSNDNRIETIGYVGQGSEQCNYGLWKWVMGNTYNAFETQADPQGWNDYVKNELNGKAKKSILTGFCFDNEPVKVEIAQCDAVVKEYSMIGTGAVAEYKQLLEQRNEKLKKAGLDKIVAEAQKQINDWLAKKGKSK